MSYEDAGNHWDARWTEDEMDTAVARAAVNEEDARRELQRVLSGLQSAMDGIRAACEWHGMAISLRAAARRRLLEAPRDAEVPPPKFEKVWP